MSVIFNPIGKVRIDEGRYFIELEEKFLEATLGLDEYSHIQAVWWFNLYDSEESRNCFVMDRPYKKVRRRWAYWPPDHLSGPIL